MENAAGVSAKANLAQAKLSVAAEAKASVPCHQQHLIASPDFNSARSREEIEERHNA